MFKDFRKIKRAMIFPESHAQVTERKGNMARKQDRPTGEEWKAVRMEMEETLGARKSGRTPITRVGKLELRVPRDRQGRFRREVFERYQRSEKALVSALPEMCIQGVSARKVKAIAEELCGQEFSAATVSRINLSLDGELEKFARRRLEEEYPCLVLDARYEKVREDGVIRGQAVMIGIGIHREGRRCVLAVGLANRESSSSGREFLAGWKQRGLNGAEFVVSDDRAGLRPARWGGGAAGSGGLAGEVAGEISQAVRLGGSQHRRDVHFPPFAGGASQTHEAGQHAGTDQRGDPAADPGGGNLPERRQLFAAGAGPDEGDSRGVD